MLGAIVGDIVGSIYEFHNNKTKEFELFGPGCCFTDDTVLTVALADSILTGTPYVANLRQFYRWYPEAGYGGGFRRWARERQPGPYNSFGNGAAMRVSPVGFAYDDFDTVLRMAAGFTATTHDHPEGIKGGQAAAAAIFLARTGKTKAEIKAYIETAFGYDLERTAAAIRPGYGFDETCQGTVPEAIIAFLEAHDFEDAIRTAISLGGDSDTLACITGGIAAAFYGGVPQPIADQAYARLDERLAGITREFTAKYCNKIAMPG
jgi:ADP-ribosylglycohydrolase